MKRFNKTGAAGLLALALTALLFMASTHNGPLGIRLISDAHAIIGLPSTPLSFAGIARRTAAEAALQPPAPVVSPPPPAATAGGDPLPIGTVVHSLPAGCTSTPVGGVDYFYCGGNFYRAAFSGNNLVYVTARS